MPPQPEIKPHLGLGVLKQERKQAHKQPIAVGPCSDTWRICLGLQLSYGRPGTETQWRGAVAVKERVTPKPVSFATSRSLAAQRGE